MQEEVKKILKRISKEKNIPLEKLIEAYRSPYELMRDSWASINIEKDSTYIGINFYILKLGTFYVQPSKIKRIKDKKK